MYVSFRTLNILKKLKWRGLKISSSFKEWLVKKFGSTFVSWTWVSCQMRALICRRGKIESRQLARQAPMILQTSRRRPLKKGHSLNVSDYLYSTNTGCQKSRPKNGFAVANVSKLSLWTRRSTKPFPHPEVPSKLKGCVRNNDQILD